MRAASPALRQFAVLPIPQEIKLQLNGTTESICNRHADPEVAANMLAMADGHLQLRKDIPVSLGGLVQVALGEKFHHWRPGAPESMVCADGLPNCCIEEDGLRRYVCMARQVGAELRLNECVRSEELIVGREGLKGGGAAAKATSSIAAGDKHAALQSENRTAAQVGKNGALDSDSRITDAAVPDVIPVLEYDRNIDFDLILLPPRAFTAVEMTSSSSGYAFSVTMARGRLSSPRGHPDSRQKWRR